MGQIWSLSTNAASQSTMPAPCELRRSCLTSATSNTIWSNYDPHQLQKSTIWKATLCFVSAQVRHNRYSRLLSQGKAVQAQGIVNRRSDS